MGTWKRSLGVLKTPDLPTQEADGGGMYLLPKRFPRKCFPTDVCQRGTTMEPMVLDGLRFFVSVFVWWVARHQARKFEGPKLFTQDLVWSVILSISG